MGFHYILVYIKNDCWYWRSDAAFRFANMDYDYRFRKDSRQKCCIIWSFIWSWICSGAYYDEVSKYLRDIAVYRFSDLSLLMWLLIFLVQNDRPNSGEDRVKTV